MTLSSGVDRLPDKFTCKLTYQVEGHSQEGPLFSQFNGQFGIADVIGYHNCGPEEPHGSTGRLLNGAEFGTFSTNNTSLISREVDPNLKREGYNASRSPGRERPS